MKKPIFRSNLRRSMKDLIRLRQSLGYDGHNLISHLAHFDRYLIAVGSTDKVLTRKLVEDWASSLGPIKPSTRAKKLHTLRILGRFIAQTHPHSFIPGPAWGPRQTTGYRPHIYSLSEIRLLLEEAAKLTPSGSLRPQTYVTLISLLYCTGLRISEALKLTVNDVDLEDGVLFVRESKFHKSRAVPLHPMAVEALREYRRSRDTNQKRVQDEASFFVNQRGRRLNYPLICATFLEVARRAGVRPPAGQKGPRIHDLRHTFATNRLLDWYRDGQDVQARLPLLSTYMGHVSIVSTQIYLEISAELLQEAAIRFKAPQPLNADLEGGLQ
jgi:integrase/recombinase XerD